MRKVITVSTFLAAAIVFAQGTHSYSALPQGSNLPTVRPDRVTLTMSENPSHSQTITWRTDTNVREAFAEVVEMDDAPRLWNKSPKSVKAETKHFNGKDVYTAELEANYHTAKLSGLKPETSYMYRVGSGENWSEWYRFKTAASSEKPFTFLYVGDAQNNIFELWSRVIRTAYRNTPKANFIIHAGDLVSDGHDDRQWQEWFDASGWIHSELQAVPTPGNHEYRPLRKGEDKDKVKRTLSVQWNYQFPMPQNGIPQLKDTNYYFDYQGARFISLNSYEYIAEQTEWLEKVLASSKNTWHIVTFHHPIYSGAKNRDNKNIRDSWNPILKRYNVDLVLTGHDHTYTRWQNKINGRLQNDGPVYVISVSGGKMYDLSTEMWKEYDAVPVKTAENTQLYQAIHIDKNRLTFEAFTANNELYDKFEITKASNGKKQITDKSAGTIAPRKFSNTIPYDKK